MIDFEDDDGREPVEPMPQDATMAVTLDALMIDRLLDRVSAEARIQTRDLMVKAAKAAISETVEETLRSLTEEALRPQVAAVIAEGWTITDRYGNTTGVRKGVKERISELLDSTEQYGNREPWVAKIAREEVQSTFKVEIEAARQRFKAEVDAITTSKLRETLAAALGLKS